MAAYEMHELNITSDWILLGLFPLIQRNLLPFSVKKNVLIPSGNIHAELCGNMMQLSSVRNVFVTEELNKSFNND